MLPSIDLPNSESPVRLREYLWQSQPLVPAFRLRMNQMADAARWLGGYFHAAAIVLQLPGGADYRPIDKPDLSFINTVWVKDRRRPLGLFVEVLRRLGCEKLLAQLPDGDGPRQAPARHVKRRLNQLTRPQLVQVAVNCLDRLVIAPVEPKAKRFYEREGKKREKRRGSRLPAEHGTRIQGRISEGDQRE